MKLKKASKGKRVYEITFFLILMTFNKIKTDLLFIWDLLLKNKKNFYMYIWLFLVFFVLYKLWYVYMFICFLLHVKILIIFIKQKENILIKNKVSLLYYYYLKNLFNSIGKSNIYNIFYLFYLFLFRTIIGYPFKYLKISLVLFDSWNKFYKQDNIKSKKIYFKKFNILTKKTLEHVLLTEITKEVKIEPKSNIRVLRRNITITTIINIYGTPTFHAYDYPYDNNNLNNYNIEDMNMVHKTNEIILTSSSKDLFLAINIIIMKYELVWSHTDLVLVVVINGMEYKVIPDYDYIISVVNKHISDTYIFKIKSEDYDLTQEQGIIVYFDSEYLYHNEILDNIIKNIKINS